MRILSKSQPQIPADVPIYLLRRDPYPHIVRVVILRSLRSWQEQRVEVAVYASQRPQTRHVSLRELTTDVGEAESWLVEATAKHLKHQVRMLHELHT